MLTFLHSIFLVSKYEIDNQTGADWTEWQSDGRQNLVDLISSKEKNISISFVLTYILNTFCMKQYKKLGSMNGIMWSMN